MLAEYGLVTRWSTATPGRQKFAFFTQHTTSCRCCLASRRSLVLRVASCDAIICLFLSNPSCSPLRHCTAGPAPSFPRGWHAAP